MGAPLSEQDPDPLRGGVVLVVASPQYTQISQPAANFTLMLGLTIIGAMKKESHAKVGHGAPVDKLRAARHDDAQPAPARPWRRVLFAAALLVTAGAVAFGMQAALAAKRVSVKHSGDVAPALKEAEVDPTKLKGEGDGRINILLLGVGGPGHEAPNLSDTILIASIDPRTKEIAMLSIPRDMYVKIGKSAKYGSSKINAAYAYGEMYKHEGGGGALAKETVSEILDVPVHYYVRVNFNAFKTAVDSVGGVEVEVPKRLYDPYYPVAGSSRTKVLDVQPGLRHFTGIQALEYARSRKTTSDFDRAARQQLILSALQQKAVSLSTLSNPVKISGLVDTIGSDVQTDLSPAELVKLASIVKEISTADLKQNVLSTDPTSYLTATTDQRGYIELPRLGLYNYEDIRNYTHSLFADSYLKQEKAAVEVVNGTGRGAVTVQLDKLLKGYGYNVISARSASSAASQSSIIDYSHGAKPYTIQYLEKRFGVKATQADRPASSAAADTAVPDVVVTVGKEYGKAMATQQAVR